MPEGATLALDAAFDFASAALFAFVATRVTSRHVDGPARVAGNLFAVWWFGLAVLDGIAGALNLVAAGGVRDLPLFVTATQAEIGVLCVALWGLLYYLAYLLTGRRSLLLPITLLYSALYASLLYLVAAAVPSHVEVDRWGTVVKYERQELLAPSNPYLVATSLLILVPIFVAAAGYVRLYFQVDEPEQKYRIGVVSLTFLLWFGSSLAASALVTPNAAQPIQDAWQVAARAIGLAAAIAVLLAYSPPRWVRRRLRREPP